MYVYCIYCLILSWPGSDSSKSISLCYHMDNSTLFVLCVNCFVFTAQCTLVHLRGLGIACRLSVCLSVRLSVTFVICDHIGWKSWKLTATDN